MESNFQRAVKSLEDFLNWQHTLAEDVLEMEPSSHPRFLSVMDAIFELIDKTHTSCAHLSERGARARMNLIWKDFLKMKRRELRFRKLQPMRFPRSKKRKLS